MKGKARAISTVVDISLALLLVTASLGVAVIGLTDNSPKHKPEDAHEAASMLASTSAQLEYSISDIQSHSAFSADGYTIQPSDYVRQTTGPPVALIADAAVAEAEIDGTELTNAGDAFEKAVDGEIRNRITGAEHTNIRVVAVWRPYPESSIEGEATAGKRPPADADISISTINETSVMPTVSEGAAEAAFYQDGVAGVSRELADAIVRGWFPVESTQIALEKDGTPHPIAAYRYGRIRNILNGYSSVNMDYKQSTVPFSYISRSDADAREANKRVRRALATVIERDLNNKYSSLTAEKVGELVTVGQVRVVIKTWSN